MIRLLSLLQRHAARWDETLRTREPPIDRAPPLAMLAAAASVADLVINRFLVRGLSAPHEVLLQLQWWGAAARNLAAVAGFVTLVVALFGFLLNARAFRLWRRVGVAGVAGVFTTMVGLACLFTPAGPFRAVGPLTAASGAALATQVAMTGARRGTHRATALACLLLSVVGFFMFAHLTVDITANMHASSQLNYAAGLLKTAAEVPYLLTLLVVVSFLPESPDTRSSRLLGLFALVVTAFSAISFADSQQALGATFSTILEGALDLQLFIDSRPEIYALWISVVMGAAVIGLLHPKPVFRQGTLAIVFLLSGGFCPRTPSRVLMFVLGAALLGRTSVALQLAKRPALFQGWKGRRTRSDGQDPNRDVGDSNDVDAAEVDAESTSS